MELLNFCRRDGKETIGRKEGNCKRYVGSPYNIFLFYDTIQVY